MFTNVGPATSHHSRVRGIHLRRRFDVFWGWKNEATTNYKWLKICFLLIWSMIMVIYGNVIYKCYIWFLGMFHPIPSYMTWSSNIGIGRKTNVWFDNVLIQKLIWFGDFRAARHVWWHRQVQKLVLFISPGTVVRGTKTTGSCWEMLNVCIHNPH